MIYYGTADNNVHPTNAMQLIHALQKAGKSFEVQVGPDLGHTGRQPGPDDGVLHRKPRPPLIRAVNFFPDFSFIISGERT